MRWADTWQALAALLSALLTAVGVRKGVSPRKLLRGIQRHLNAEEELAAVQLENESLRHIVKRLGDHIRTQTEYAEMIDELQRKTGAPSLIDLFIGRESRSPAENPNSLPKSTDGSNPPTAT